MVDFRGFCFCGRNFWIIVAIALAGDSDLWICAWVVGVAAYVDSGGDRGLACAVFAREKVRGGKVAAIRAGVISGVCLWDGIGGYVGGGDSAYF